MKWEKELDGLACYDNHGNDYYLEWADIKVKEYNLLNFFQEYLLGTDCDAPVKIKVRKGAILIERIGDFELIKMLKRF